VLSAAFSGTIFSKASTTLLCIKWEMLQVYGCEKAGTLESIRDNAKRQAMFVKEIRHHDS
jgi:hypothetical protein